MAETAELGSNNLSHDLARVGTIPAYQKFWHVDGPHFLPAQRTPLLLKKAAQMLVILP